MPLDPIIVTAAIAGAISLAGVGLTLFVGRHLQKSLAGQQDASAANEVAEAAKGLLAPLNDQIAKFVVQVAQMTVVNGDLAMRQTKSEADLVLVKNLADRQEEHIFVVEKEVRSLTTRNEELSQQIIAQHVVITNLQDRLSESESSVRGLRAGVSVLTNQLERAGIKSEYHPTDQPAIVKEEEN